MEFLDLIRKSPLPIEGGKGGDVLESLAGGVAAADVQALCKHPRGGEFLRAVFDGSPFLAGAALSRPEALATALRLGPDPAVEKIVSGIRGVADAPNLAAAMRGFRALRTEAALTIALADLAGAWSTMQTTLALSQVASASIDAALLWLLRDGARRNVFERDVADIDGAGVIVLGMGKLGADELNYSSDIDLILLYDEALLSLRRPDRTQHEMTRLARGLVQLLEERTRDGYAFRTDLRLRPDPASTPPAITIQAAEAYYESMGQNWERAAMIKARPVAGDIASGETFLEYLRPFVWRRSLDFNAIRDIQSIKRQIDRKDGGGAPTAFEHNVKLGRGGIREIEFFAQTQQLIWGGRDPDLRIRQTMGAIDALAEAGHVEPDVAREMNEAYVKLRDIEHRLQMVNDRQTHTTPAADEMTPFARFAGFETAEAFASDLEATLSTVAAHFSALFADGPSLGGGDGGALSFVGADEHPETHATIRKMGYADPERVVAAIRGWHHGHARAMRTQRAREILTELTPDLLRRFAQSQDPDRAFAAFEKFVGSLPAGVQLFSLLDANRELLDFLARILGRSAYLADLIGRRPHVIDVVLTDDFMNAPPDRAGLAEELAQELRDAQDLQDTLDGARRWLNDLRLCLGVQTIEARSAPSVAAAALSDAADVVVERLLHRVAEEFEEAHGVVEGGAYGVMAYGKWGSRELSIGSDLDLVAVYDAPEGAASTGARSLPAPVYYMRLTQRLSTALSTQTGEGRLFDVDLRLRPNGEDGPIAVQLESYRRYLTGDAWTWELMALTRARFAAGDADLGARLEAARCDGLAAAAERPDLMQDVHAMRLRLAQAKKSAGPWDVRRRDGGMIDVEFIAQGLALANGGATAIQAARRPQDQLCAVRDTALAGRPDAGLLAEAARFWLEAQWVVRLIGLDEATDDTGLHVESRATFAKALGEDSYEALVKNREAIAERVRTAYIEIIESA